MPSPSNNRLVVAALVIAYACLCALAHLGSYPLIDPDEPRYAQSAREMMARGDYIVPYINEEPRLNKPPLFYWLEIASYRAFGGPSEFSARFPSAVAALAMGLFVFLMAREFYGRAAGALSVPILFSMPLFAGITHLATTDAAMTAFLTAALYCWHRFQRSQGRTSLIVVSWFMLALSVLSKGPIALVLYVLVVVAFCASRRQWGLLARSFHPAALCVFLVVVLPWPVVVGMARPDAAVVWYRETFQRFLHGVDHPRNPLLPVGVLVAGTMPWFFGLPRPARATWRARWAALVADGPASFLFWWVAAVVLFFTLCGTQLANYLLPVTVPVAIAVSGSLGRLMEEGKGGTGTLLRVMVAAVALSAGAAIYALREGVTIPSQGCQAALIVVSALVFTTVFVRARRYRAATVCAVMSLALAGAIVLPSVMREVAVRRSLATLAYQWRAAIRAADEVYFHGHIQSNMSLVYYTGRHVEPVKKKPEYDAALNSAARMAMIQYEAAFRRSFYQREYDGRHFLAGRITVYDRTFVLVTNWPSLEGARRIIDITPGEVGVDPSSADSEDSGL